MAVFAICDLTSQANPFRCVAASLLLRHLSFVVCRLSRSAAAPTDTVWERRQCELSHKYGGAAVSKVKRRFKFRHRRRHPVDGYCDRRWSQKQETKASSEADGISVCRIDLTRRCSCCCDTGHRENTRRRCCQPSILMRKLADATASCSPPPFSTLPPVDESLGRCCAPQRRS